MFTQVVIVFVVARIFSSRLDWCLVYPLSSLCLTCTCILSKVKRTRERINEASILKKIELLKRESHRAIELGRVRKILMIQKAKESDWVRRREATFGPIIQFALTFFFSNSPTYLIGSVVKENPSLRILELFFLKLKDFSLS